MNILVLNSAESWGGDPHWTNSVAASLSGNHNVFLAYKSDIIGDRCTTKKRKLPFRFNYDPSTVRTLTSIVKNNNIDFVFSTKKRDYIIAGIVSRLCGIKNVIMLGMVRNLGRHPYKNLVYNKLTDGIIVNSRQIKDVLLRSPFIKEAKVRVIYNGIDIDALEFHSKNGTIPDKPFPFMVSKVGRISERKGIDIIINAFASFLRRIQSNDAGLILIGTGSRLQQYKKLTADLGITDRVLFTGFLSNPYPYLTQSDVHISASKNEGLSLGMLEAMYFENAVVTSRSGGGDDVVVDRQNGLLCESMAIDEWTDRLVTLYNDEMLRKALGKAARISVVEKFSQERMTSDITQFCNDILESSQ